MKRIVEIILWSHQKKTIDQIKEKLRMGFKKILVVLPTGAGKSIIMGVVANICLNKDNKVLALMHRRNLVLQLLKKFKSCNVDSGVIMSKVDSRLFEPVQAGTIQTFSKRIKLGGSWRHPADVVFIDEAHRSLSKTYQDTLKLYKDKIVIGFTATPTLSSGVGMGNYFQTLIQPVGVRELINQGYLVPSVCYGLTAPDLAGLKKQGDDYEKKGLGERYNNAKLIGDVVKNWNEIAFGLKTMLFAVNVKHSMAIVYEFNKYGIPAEHLDAHSSDEEREATIKRFRAGETFIVSNVDLYTEGTDIPEIECIVLATATKSIGRYLQMVGRGARIHPESGKKEFIVLDHGKNITGRDDSHGYYEDPIEWTLEGKKISYKKPAPISPKEKHKMSCEKCNAIFTGSECPRCGTKIENYGKKIEALEADLKKMTGGKEKKNKQTELLELDIGVLIGMLKYEADRLEKGDSWVRANYKNITNNWPPTLDYPPIQSSDKLKKYLTHLRVKWIKSPKNKKFLKQDVQRKESVK